MFGNVNDKASRVSQDRQNNPQRLFYSLEQLHVLPNVSYLAKVRNTDEVLAGDEHHEEGHEAAGHGAEAEHGAKPAVEGAHH
ncbi:hypothetical protein LWM68_42820 [Niabella sp. W65]|nr:hypothetical protein [Niabella sp. W65]MCH7368879.1 hypothetical protein [Niabella sp. W65]